MTESDIRLITDKVINYIFMGLIALSVLVLCALMIAGLWCCIDAIITDFDVNKLLKGIEFVFISPLPLLIASAFYKMYSKTIKRTILKNESKIDFERDQIMVDLTITKYLFTSTIISTLLVILIELLYGVIHQKNTPILYEVIILGLALLGILIYYISRISHHLDHKIKESKDSIQERFIDTVFMQKKLTALKDDLAPQEGHHGS